MSFLAHSPPLGQARQRELMKSATPMVYAEPDGAPLRAHWFMPAEESADRPVIIWLHGGFWDTVMPTQFAPQCLHFARRGAVAAAVETRVRATHGTGPVEALEDVRRFLDCLADRAGELGIDPGRVVLAGASGGAFLALRQVLPKGESRSIDPRALILFSPLLDTTAPSVVERFPDPRTAKALSPLKQVRRKLPPMLLCHGKEDRVTPFAHAEKFARSMKWRRNRVEFVDFERADHSFFNFNVSDLYYELTLQAADRFLVELGLLEPDELEGV